jgi:4,5-dihydroxyphthalate decarboxylase
MAIDLYGGDYEYTLDLGGEFDGVEVRYHALPIVGLFQRMIRERAYEACEFSLANYILMKDAGEDALHAVPVFLNRAFRHGTIYVRADSKLTDPRGLRGGRIGVPDYSMTAAVWVRGLLDEQYGVHWSDLRWFCDAAHARFSPPDGVRLTQVTQDLETMLVDGEIDAFISFGPRDERLPQDERRLRRLLPDYLAVEREYYRATGIYPINHCVVVRSDLLQREPNAPAVLFDAYSRAMTRAYERRLGSTLMPWGKAYWAEAFEPFGGDPMPHGLTDDNRRIVDKLVDYLHEQRFITRRWSADSLFVDGAAAFRESAT